MKDKYIEFTKINVKNIREAHFQREISYSEAKQDFKDGLIDKFELNWLADEIQKILGLMTPEQRSLCLDDFEEIPGTYNKILKIVKQQEK